MSILDSISLFDSLSEHERTTLVSYSQERILKSGEILFQEGDAALALYVVKSGELMVYKERSEGRKLIGHNTSGDLVWEMAIFDLDIPKHRMASVQAAQDSVLLVIMDYAITELSKKHSEIYSKITEIIAQRKRKNMER